MYSLGSDLNNYSKSILKRDLFLDISISFNNNLNNKYAKQKVEFVYSEEKQQFHLLF